MPFSKIVFNVEHYFPKQSYDTVKPVYQVHFPDDTVPNKLLKPTTLFFSEFPKTC